MDLADKHPALSQLINGPKFLQTVELILDTAAVQQQGTLEEVDNPAYLFRRSSSVPTDSCMLEGRGPPAKRCGLIKCMFRPSDDATTMPFLVSTQLILQMMFYIVMRRFPRMP